MKKFLSLVLALVMTMSLVTISAGAKDFTDDDAINYNEAIDVMSAVKVIDGYTDGSFKPQTQLNRGQAAKIICNMVLGPTTASALKADAAPFKDVAADNTFAGYIAYCVQAGLIDGYTDGTYKPTAPLTGYAFMKYLLGCLGYDKDVEGYNGPNWSINVAKQALAIGLDNGLTEDFDGTKIVTREEACLFAFNAMKATMVEYESSTQIVIGDATVTTTGNRREMSETSAYPDKLEMTGLQFSERYFKDLRRTPTQDAFGRPANLWKLKADKIDTYVDYSKKIAEYTGKVKKGDLYDLVGSTTAKYLNSAAGSADLHVYMNGAYAPNTDQHDMNPGGAADMKGQIEQVGLDGTLFVKNSSSKIGGAGVKTEVYLDDSGANPVVTFVSIGSYLYKASGDYNAKKDSLKVVSAGDTDAYVSFATTTLYGDDFDIIKDVKDGDYLLLTLARNGSTYDVKSVTPAETVTGVVNTFSQEGSNVTIGGTKYSYAFPTIATLSTMFTVGQEAAVVLDAYGNVIAVDKAVVNSNYVFIRATDRVSTISSKAIADAYFTDGTSAQIDLKEVVSSPAPATLKGDNLATWADTSRSGWYTFSKNSADQYTLTAVESKYDANSAERDDDTQVAYVTTATTAVINSTNATIHGTSVYGDSKTVFVVKEADGTVTSYVGVKNVPDIKTGSTVTGTGVKVSYLAKSNNLAGFVFIDLANTNAVIEGAESSDLLYVLKYDGKTWIDDMNTYHTYKVLDANAEETTIKTDNRIFSSYEDSKGNVYNLFKNPRTNGNGYVTSAPAVTDGAGSTSFISGTLDGHNASVSSNDAVVYSNDTIWLWDNTLGTPGYRRFVLADDAKIILVALKGTGLNRDPGASYEADIVSGKTLAAVLDGHTVTGTFDGQLKSSTSNVITTLYVTVTGA